MELELQEQPEDHEVQKMYVAALKALAIPEETQKKLIDSQTVEKKWQMIQMNKAQLGDCYSYNKRDKNVLKYFAELDDMTTPSHSQAVELKTRLQTANLQWIQDFFADGGCQIITKVLRNISFRSPRSALENAVLLELLDCFMQLMNTSDGMNETLETPGSIEAIASCLDLSCGPLARTVLEILSVTCYFGDSGWYCVNDAILNLHRRLFKIPYALFTDFLADDSNYDIATCEKIVIFLVDFIYSGKKEDRCHIRSYLISQDFLENCEALVENFEIDTFLDHYQSAGNINEDETRKQEFSVNEQSGDTKDPSTGYMSSPCFAIKEKAGKTVKSFLRISNIKKRIYMLNPDNMTLSWEKEYEKDTKDDVGNEDNIVEIKTFLEIRDKTEDKDLKKESKYCFDIVTENRTLSLGVESEEIHKKWLIALNFCLQKAQSFGVAKRLNDTALADSDILNKIFNELQKRIRVFKGLIEADHRDNIQESLQQIDISDAYAVFDLLHGECLNAGLLEELLQLVHQVLLLPQDHTLGKRSWTVLLQLVAAIRNYNSVSTDSDEIGNWILGFDEIQNLVKSRRVLDEKLKQFASNSQSGSFGQSSVITDSKEVKELEQRIRLLQQQLLEEQKNSTLIKEKLVATEQKLSSKTEIALATKKSTSPVNPMAAMLSNKLKTHHQVIPTEELSSNKTPKGMVKACEHPKYAPLFKLMKMTGNKEAAKQRAAMTGVDPEILEGDPDALIPGEDASGENPKTDTSKEVSSSPKPVNPLAAMLAGKGGGGRGPKLPSKSLPVKKGPTPEEFGLKRKEKVQTPEDRKMKPVFWSQIPLQDVKQTIWGDLWDNSTAIDTSLLLEGFSTSSKSDKKVIKTVKKDNNTTKTVALVDAKRNQNVLIGLGRFRMKPEDMKKKFVSVDRNMLSLENCQKLILLFPTSEEEAAVTGYGGDESLLGPVEQFFLMCTSIPRLQSRFKQFIFSMQFAEQYAIIHKKVMIIEKAANSISSSVALKKVLEVILAAGNYLNGTTARGGAYGFKLEFLEKIGDIKANVSTFGTLLNFVVKQCDEKVPESKSLLDELHDVHDGSEISGSQLDTELNGLKSQINICKKEIKELEALHSENDFAEPMRGILQDFIDKAEPQVEELKGNWKTIKQYQSDLMSKYGEDINDKSNGDSIQHFFSIFSHFSGKYRMAREANILLAKQEAKRKKAIENEKAISNVKESSGEEKTNKKNDLFGDYAKQKEKSADAMIEEFKSKLNSKFKRTRASLFEKENEEEEWDFNK